MRVILLSLLLAFTAHAADPADGRQPTVSATAATASQPPAPILDAHAWRAWLRAHNGQPAPLDRLGVGARARFLSSIHFGRSGLDSLPAGDELANALSDAHIKTVYRWFGPDIAPLAPASRLRRGSTPEDPQQVSALEKRHVDYTVQMRAQVRDASPATLDRAALLARYNRTFPEARDAAALQAMSGHDLFLLLQATAQTARLIRFATETPKGAQASLLLQAYQHIHADAMQRGITDQDDAQALRDALLGARDFAAAQALTARTHGLPALPRLIDRGPLPTGQPTLWRLSPDGTSMTRTAFDLSGQHLLVTAGCHFSEDVAAAIASDPELLPVFKRHAQWLVPAPGSEDIAAAVDWNKRFPHAPVAMVYDRAEWKVLAGPWLMPHYLLVKDGRVIESAHAAWRPGYMQPRDELVAMLRRAGWLPAATAKKTAAGKPPH